MKEDFKLIWETDDWTLQARKIIESIPNFSKNSSLIIILRHSHRIDTADMQLMVNLGLTDMGKEITRIFGSKLPKSKYVKLYHSTVSRCKETADSILDGFKNIGGLGEVIGPIEPLYSIGNEPDFVLKMAYKYPGAKFINRWAIGLFPNKYIKNFTTYSIEAATRIWNQSNESKFINIHITHDLILMALKYGWFGIAPDKDWVNLLGGFIMAILKDKIILSDQNGFHTYELPHWFRIIL